MFVHRFIIACMSHSQKCHDVTWGLYGVVYNSASTVTYYTWRPWLPL